MIPETLVARLVGVAAAYQLQMNRLPRTLNSAEEMRVLAGLLVQPFLAGGLAFIAFPLLLLDQDGRTLAGGYPSDPTDAALSVAMGTFVVAGVVTLFGVLPTAVWIIRRHQLSLTVTLVFGLGFGNLPYVLMAAAWGTHGQAGLLRGAAFASLLGLSGAALFWMMTLRPQKSRHDVAGG
jgi:hypothetical protein